MFLLGHIRNRGKRCGMRAVCISAESQSMYVRDKEIET